jgi:ribosomal protein S6--L-glutamate ligase
VMTKICFLEQPGRRSPDSVMPLTVRRLGELGCAVEVLVPERAPAALRRFALEADLYLWKSHERLCDSLAAEIHTRGLPLVNDYFGTLRVRDKIVTSMRLMDAGLPTPDAYYAGSVEHLRAVVKDYPVVVKPNAGRRGQQISVARRAEELEGLDLSYGDIFAQQFVKGSGLDLKAYIVGDEVFGVARPFPVRTAEEKRGKPRTISPEVRDICLRCGELFDLELYGVDLIETEDGPYVIEVNCFPGYKGVPEADRLLAGYIFERAANLSPPQGRGSNLPQAVESSA